MFSKNKPFHSAILLCIVFFYFASSGIAMALPNGISGRSGATGAVCTGCHSSGAAVPSATFSGPKTVSQGSTNSFSITMTGGPAVTAGFDLRASAGTLINTNIAGVKLLNSELTHSAPNAVSGGTITWTFDWTAPVAEGTFTFYVAVLSTNGSGSTSGDGMDTATYDVTVANFNQPPVADISGPSTANEGVSVAFDGSGSADPDGSIVSYDWDFGDGSAGSGVTVNHVFAAGNYTVTLTVMDDDGDTDSTSLPITIDANAAPVAVISAPASELAGVAVAFDGSGSSDSDGIIKNYDWEFGDGSGGSGVNVTHVYAKGNYNVTLTITDDKGRQDSATVAISITTSQPPVANIAAPLVAAVGEMVSFDASGSSDPDGTIVSYDWDFGDGSTGSGVSAQHSFVAGSYNVTLTVTDDQGDTDSASVMIKINQAPVAAITGPSTGTQGTQLSFDASASSDSDGSIVSYAWDFGDGGTGSGVTVNHAFVIGDYSVVLTVTDDNGASDTDSLDVSIAAAPVVLQSPQADVGGPYSAIVNKTVQFDGSGSSDADGTIVKYQWDFGDGSSDTGVNPVHTFDTTGTYTVKLTVTDNDNKTASSQTTLNVVTIETAGKDLYNTYCAECHGTEGDPGGLDSDAIATTASNLLTAIEQQQDMAYLADDLAQVDSEAIVAYLAVYRQVHGILDNLPPNKPQLFSPQDQATGLETTLDLKWRETKDGDGDHISYLIHYCDNNAFSGCEAIVYPTQTAESKLALNGLGLGLSGLFLVGMISFTGMTRRQKVFNIVLIVIVVLLMNACGGGSSSGKVLSFTVSGLEANTTYYWKITAVDSVGNSTESDVWSFTTQ